MSAYRDAGKGSKPRPFSVSQSEWDNRWDAIFQRDIPKADKQTNDYQDILSTEDCILGVFENEKSNS
jgi:hypothetical protein